VLDRPSRGWRGLTYTPAATRLLQDLRRDLLAAPPSEEVIGEPSRPPRNLPTGAAPPLFQHQRDATAFYSIRAYGVAAWTVPSALAVCLARLLLSAELAGSRMR
jgi:hypothetical protein